MDVFHSHNYCLLFSMAIMAVNLSILASKVVCNLSNNILLHACCLKKKFYWAKGEIVTPRERPKLTGATMRFGRVEWGVEEFARKLGLHASGF